MANVLNITSSLEPVIDTTHSAAGSTPGGAIGGQSYTDSSIDKNTGSLGGLYKNLEYTAADAVKWSGVLIKDAAFALADGAFKGGSDDRTGTVPTKSKVLAVSYDSTLGTSDRVIVTIGSQIHARLQVGEACVIPISGSDDAGLAVAEFKLHTSAYTVDTHEATVTVVMIGV